MLKRMIIAALAAGLAGGAASEASATAHVTITASGVWGANAPTTAYSEAGKSFSVSFTSPTAFAFTTTNGGFTIPTTEYATELTAFHYKLDGVDLPITLSPTLAPACSATYALCGVELFDSASGGGFALDFGDASVEFYELDSKDMGTGGAWALGSYKLYPNLNGSPSGGMLNEGATPFISGGVVPEPASWALSLLGFGLAGAALRRRRAYA